MHFIDMGNLCLSARGHTAIRIIPQIILLLVLSSLPLYAQQKQPALLDTRISVQLENVSLKTAVKALEKGQQFTFIYNTRELPDERNVTLNVRQQPLRNILDQLLGSRHFSYKVAGNNILIKKTADRPAGQQQPADTTHLVTGRIVNDLGEALAGATVRIRNKNKGTVTDAGGNYRLQVENTDVLMFIYMGYKTREVQAGSLRAINMQLLPDNSKLGEVVVTGVVQRSYESFTGAITTFNREELRTVGNQNVVASLRALDPSFQVFENNLNGSNPNLLPEIQLRGASNLTDLKGKYTGNPNQPLFILDGFEVSLQKIMDLDMNRVEKVTILKDATGTALYGSRGANGVVVIETEQPEPGKLRLSYTGDISFETPDLRTYHLLNSVEKLDVELAAGLYDYPGRLDVEQLLKERYHRRLKEVKRGVNTDWLSQPLRTGIGQRHYLYLDGGDAYFRYAADFSYNNQQGVMKGSGRRTYSGGMMLSYRFKTLQFRNYLSVTQNRADNSPYGSFNAFAKMNPYWRMTDETGAVTRAVDTISTPGLSGYLLQPNPLHNGEINTRSFDSYLQLMDNFSIDWAISPSLKLRSNLSLLLQKNEGDLFLPPDHTYFANYSEDDYFRKGSYTQTRGKNNSYQLSTYLDFNRLWGGRHLLTATGGINLGENASDDVMITAEGFPSQFLDNILYASQYLKDGRPGGSESLSRRVSLQSNFNYSYNNRYVADFSLSTDGSSRFGTENKFAPFWSAGLGWNVHRERWAERLGKINYLKLRLSYGSSGSQNFPAYQAMTTYGYYSNIRYLNSVGAYLLGLGNNELRWQQKNTLNLGADISLFDDRIALTANYFRDRTENQLIDLSVPPSTGFSSYKENLGEVQNIGYELNARIMLIRREQKRIFWNVTASVFRNENKLLNISDALDTYNKQQNTDQEGKSAPRILYREGESMSAIYTVPSLGIDPANGKEVFIKQDGTRTYVWDADDKTARGDFNPRYRGLFGTNLILGGLTFNTAFSYQLGGQAYNQTLVDRVENADLLFNVDKRVYEQRWRKPGDHTFFKDVADKTVTLPTSRFVQDDDRLICESVSMQYDFAKTKFIQHLGMRLLRISGYMMQPFRFTSIRQERGLDYPFSHRFSFSIQTGF